MSDEEQYGDEIAAAREVRTLKNGVLDNFFENKDRQFFETFKQIPIGSVDDLVNLHTQVKSLNALRVELQSVLNTGKMAQVKLDELNK